MVSAEEKLLGLQREICETLCCRFAPEPQRCFFVDDSPADAAAAQGTGRAGTIFRGDAGRARRELRQASAALTSG